jgi:hypothetical protein
VPSFGGLLDMETTDEAVEVVGGKRDTERESGGQERG